ncbi:ribbon-helix-helix domain-containing protein [Azospirillum picis]|uniref:DNA-binding ribbon-helix-helix protein n=1 Tax=Azospirillum picis TaxID=488438 RepID=A0ABU0ME46_9PROT|nr:ribbon-helix-helix domain-containing protein [Azospirillum picis]MBP2297844.1 putative DNA-binding ribbon-helix-helix protein [Azospirillum picis]MDQ0531682.1 putative DNA-binding ribbon-helix-helix protein [Azospirillum picis]
MKRRSLMINGRRVTLRMEKEIWQAVDDVARRRCMTVSDLVSEADRSRGNDSLTAAVRVGVVDYYRRLVDNLDRYGMTRAVLSKPFECRKTVSTEHTTLQ